MRKAENNITKVVNFFSPNWIKLLFCIHCQLWVCINLKIVNISSKIIIFGLGKDYFLIKVVNQDFFFPMRQLHPDMGESIAKFIESLKLPYIFASLSYFGSLAHHPKIHKVDILFLQFFWSKLWGSFGKSVGHWYINCLKQWNHL